MVCKWLSGYVAMQCLKTVKTLLPPPPDPNSSGAMNSDPGKHFFKLSPFETNNHDPKYGREPAKLRSCLMIPSAICTSKTGGIRIRPLTCPKPVSKDSFYNDFQTKQLMCSQTQK